MSKLLFMYLLLCNFILTFLCKDNAFLTLSDKEAARTATQMSASRIKKMSVTTYDYKKKLDGFSLRGRLIQSTVYSEDGKPEEINSYFANGSIKEKFEYDKNNRVVKYSELNPESTMSTIHYHQYSKKGRLEKTEVFNIDSTKNSTISYSYTDTSCQMVKKGTEGNQMDRTVTIVKNEQLLEVIQLFDSKDVQYKVDSLEFDPSFQRKRWVMVNKSYGLYRVIHFYIEYGHSVKEEVSTKEGKLRKTKTHSYDDKGNIIESIVYENDGTPSTQTKYTYEYFD